MTAPDVDLLAEEYAEQWPEGTDNDAAILARAYLRVRGERDDWKRRRDNAVETCRFRHQDGLTAEEWHTRICGAMQGAQRERRRAEAAEARLAAVAEWAETYRRQWVPGDKPPGYTFTFDMGVGAAAQDVLALLAPDAAPSPGVEGEAARIEDLIERSSLGTPEAKALRATVSDERAARIVALAARMADAPTPTHSWTPEDPCACGSPDTCPATPAAPTDEGVRLVSHPTPGKAWVMVPHRNDISNDWIEVDLPARLGEGLSEEAVHWGSDDSRPTSLHGNGAASFARTTLDPAAVTCRLCCSLLADRARGLGGDQ